MYNEQIRFTLRLETPFGSNNFQDYILEDEPFINDKQDPERQLFWHDVPKTFERIGGTGAFNIKYIESMIFVKKARTLLKGYFDQYAPNGIAYLIVEISNPNTDVFELEYEGQIDMADKYSDKDEQFKVSIINGGLRELINAQESQKFELDRTTFIDGEFTKPTDIKGNEITEIQYQTNSFLGRKLKNQSFLENPESFTHIAEFEPGLGEISTNFISDHFIKYQSDELVKDVIGVEDFRKVTFATPNWILTTGQYFYGPSDRDKTLRIVFKQKANIVFSSVSTRASWFLVRATESSTPGEFVGSQDDDIRIAFFEDNRLNYDWQEEITINVKQGEVLSYVTNVDASANQPTTVTVPEKGVSIFIDEDSVFPSSQSPCLTLKEANERLMEIITGNRDQFLSDFFTNGYWKDLTISSGKMIRNLPKVNEDRDPLDQIESITTSLKELKSISGYLLTGHGVEIHNGVEKYVIEDLRHFYRTNVTIYLGEVYDLEEVPATDFYFNGAKFGNEKAGDYEEQFGLYETNALNEYGFPTNKVIEQFDGTSKLRSDAIPIELLRRKGFEYAPTEDTSYDKENFINDCKIVNGLYTPKLWQDVLEEQPKKVYDPDSAWNFTLTPLQSLLRHGWWFKTLLYKFNDDFVRYKSSTGFSGMITKHENQPEYAENGNIPITDLETEQFEPKEYTCKVKKTYELKKQLEGVFQENGRDIPNIYGLAQYTYQNGEPQYCWIMKSQITREIKLQIRKINF